MSPLTKESDVLTAPSQPSAAQPPAPASRPEDVATKPQPVALEVPVTVNGGRTVPGSDKREPFSEATKTVLVFGTGAVIRLVSQVEPGQLLFLTNEKTKKEVVCQVVKSKTYRSVSGYVELEFTEPALGFWGMRFPGDRSAPQLAPVVPTSSGSAPANLAPISPVTASPAVASPLVTSNVHTSPPSSAGISPVKVSKPATPPELPVATKPGGDPSSTQALKLEAARLQEQLSSMLFVQPGPAKPGVPPPALDPKGTSESTSKILEFARPAPVSAALPASILEASPATASSAFSTSLLADEQVKVPSWLEPLARNAAIPAPPAAPDAPVSDSLPPSEEVKVPSWLEPLARNTSVASTGAPVVSQPTVRDEAPVLEQFADSADPVSAHSNADEAPAFGSRLLAEEYPSSDSATSGGSKKGFLIAAVAAGILLTVAASTRYFRQADSNAPSQVAAASVPAPAPSASPEAALVQPSSRKDSFVPTSAVPAPVASPASNPQKELQPASQVLRVPRDAAKAPVANLSPAANRAPEPIVEPQRKLALGEIKLAAPKVKRGASSQGLTEAAPNVLASDESSVPNSAALTAGLAGSQPTGPAAPVASLPVGGNVKTAQLVSSVHPIYPQLAKSQHVSGDVRVDALIDANGRVTTMKVISGPTLLHQAAMDALRQWKYKPALLNGSPTSTHLTVTIQFRLQ